MPSNFQFITVSDLDQMRDEATISQIRRHAMRDVGISRRLPNSRRSRQRKLLSGSSQASAAEQSADSAPDAPAASTASTTTAASPSGIWSVTPSQEDAAAFAQFGPLDVSALQNPAARSLSVKPDPFDSAPIAINNTVSTLIHYYTYHFHENGNWVYETGSLPPDPELFRQFVAEKADLAFEDEFTMYCLLSAAAARMRNRDHVRSESIEQQRHFSMYKALQMLQKRIDDVPQATKQSTEELLHCIMWLAAAEVYEDKYEAAKTHRNAIAILLRFIGGPAMIDNGYTRGQVLALDVLLACNTLKPCLIDHTFDPGPLSSNRSVHDWKLSIALDESETGSALLETGSQIVSPPLQALVHSLVEIQGVRIRLDVAPASSAATEAKHWVLLRTASIRTSILAFEASISATQAVRIALLMHTLLFDHDMTRAWVVRTQARMLRQCVETSSVDEWRDCDNVKFWALLMGYFCARDDAEEKKWFFTAIQRLWAAMGENLSARIDGDTTTDKLLRIQRRFLFHEPLQGPMTEQLAQSLDV